MPKDSKIIDMVKVGGVYLPRRSPMRETQAGQNERSGGAIKKRGGEPQQIGKILESIAIDFFKAIRREMFR